MLSNDNKYYTTVPGKLAKLSYITLLCMFVIMNNLKIYGLFLFKMSV